MTDQQLEEFDKDKDESEDVEAHRRRLAEDPEATDDGDDDEVEAHRRRSI